MREILLVISVSFFTFMLGFALVGRWYWWNKGFDAAEGVWIPAMKRLGDRLTAELKDAYRQLEKAEAGAEDK
jgi:hypothetical protein